MREVDRDEPGGQQPGRDILIGAGGGVAGGAFLGDGGQAVDGGQDDVGGGCESLLVQRREQPSEVGVGVADGGEGGWAVDSGDESHRRVVLILRGIVRVVGPEDHDERFMAVLERGQRRQRGDVGEPFALFGIGGQGCRTSERGVCRGGRGVRETEFLERGLHLRREWRAAGMPGAGVNDHRRLGSPIGVVGERAGITLADCGGGDIGRGGSAEEGLLVVG